MSISTFVFRTSAEVRNFEEENAKIRFSRIGYEYDGSTGWRLGEIGIWAGQISAWKKFLNSKYDYLCLFEDDVAFHGNFVDVIHETILRTPIPWDVISLFVPETEYEKMVPSRSLLVPIFQDWSTLVYLVSRNGAINLLSALERKENIDEPVDWWLWRNRPNLKMFAINPQITRPFNLANIESTFQQSQKRQMLQE